MKSQASFRNLIFTIIQLFYFWNPRILNVSLNASVLYLMLFKYCSPIFHAYDISSYKFISFILISQYRYVLIYIIWLNMVWLNMVLLKIIGILTIYNSQDENDNIGLNLLNHCFNKVRSVHHMQYIFTREW